MNLGKVYGKKESDDHATSLFTSLQILFVSVLCTAVMACVDSLEFCLPHSASVHCTLGSMRLGTLSPLRMALSQTTLLTAPLTPFTFCSLLTDPLGPSPLACLMHQYTLCAGPGVLVLSASPVAWSPGSSYRRDWKQYS